MGWTQIVLGGLNRTSVIEAKAVGRWPKLFRFVTTPWGIDFLWFNAQYHCWSITTKSSQAKNLQNTEKIGDQ
jgi:hypothetical protein